MNMNATSSVQSGDIRQGLPLHDEGELKSMLLPLCAALAPLHEAGRLHGGLSLSSIRLDESGRASLENGWDSPTLNRKAPVAPLLGVLEDGYAAFEQYMDEDAWPLGPWTDVHALSAIAYVAVTGETPAHAVARMKGRSGITFSETVRQRYSPALLAAMARGLSTHGERRPQNVQEFMAALGWRPEDPLLQEDVPAVPTASGAAQTAARARPTPVTRSWGPPALVLALFAAVLGVWAASGNEDAPTAVSASASQAPVAPAMETLPPPAVHTETPATEFGPLASDPPPAETETPVPTPVQHDNRLLPAAVAVAEEAIAGSTEPAAIDPAPIEQEAVAMVETPEPVPEPLPAPASEPEPEPEPVGVALDIQPWGEVFVDGELRGVSPPLKQLKLVPGSYRIRIQNGDLPAGEQRLVVQQGEPARLSHVFPPSVD